MVRVIIKDNNLFDGSETLDIFGVSFIRDRRSTPVRWTNTNCTGNEDHLTDCFYDESTCEEKEDVGLICAQPNAGNYIDSLVSFCI